jgi:diguanylate cyclase (GGDEF)-like protein/PAS domain S-box-containing protein
VDDDLLLQTLLSSPRAAVIAAEPDGTIVRWSSGAAALYGWQEHEIVGRPVSVLVPPDQEPVLLDRCRRLLAGEDLPPQETVGLARDGSQLELLVHLMLVRDRAGKPIGTLSLNRDLAPVRRIKQSLTATEQELRARFEGSLIPQSLTDLEGRILAANPAMADLLGRDLRSLVGANAVELYAEEDRPAVLAALARLVAGEVHAMAEEHTLVRADGAGLRTITSVTLVQASDGQPLLAASVEDVTALRQAEEEARTQAGLFRDLLETMPVVVFAYDAAGRCTWARGKDLASFGVTEEQLLGASLFELYGHLPEVREGLQSSLAGHEGRAVLTLGERSWKTFYRPVRGADGVVTGGLSISLDVSRLASAERELRANEARLRALLRSASDVVLVVAEDGRMRYVSPSVTALFGYDEREVLWKVGAGFDHPEDRDRLAGAWSRVLRGPGATELLECRVRHADGSWRWTEQSMTNLLEDPDIAGVVVNVRDVTDRRQAEIELQRLALQDGLTGLANRALLLDRTEQALVRAQRAGAQVALILLDVVGLAEINDQLGHDGGDLVLRAAAERINDAVRPTDTVARISGGEFAVLVDGVASTEDLRARTAMLVDAARGPLDVAGSAAELRLRAGSALSPAADAGALLAAAERAMPDAGGAPRVVLAGASDGDAPSRASRTAASVLRRAIDREELRLHYQPVIGLKDGRLTGVEALVRWQHSKRGLLGPADFVPLAESSGAVVELGAWVLREACDQAARWQAEGRELAVGINLSPRQMVGGQFLDLVGDVLKQTGARPDLLVLEVTESAVMDDPGAAEVLQALRDLGAKLALDDFGTGYSSLTYLKRFPVDSIKIDRSFVAGLGRDPDDDAIVASVGSLARSVGKTVVAEGVETAAQLAILRGLRVDQAQGFLWSPPLPADQLEGWFADWRPSSVADVGPAGSTAGGHQRGSAAVPAGDDDDRILQLHAEGASLHTIAAALNAEGRRTPAGPRWTTRTVARVVAARTRVG